jgi:hypothetical protein
MNPLVEKLENANMIELDIAFALLKYKEIGIYRKIQALCLSFDLNLDEVLKGLPQEEGRLLDWETRHFIHHYMITRANEFQSFNKAEYPHDIVKRSFQE